MYLLVCSDDEELLALYEGSEKGGHINKDLAQVVVVVFVLHSHAFMLDEYEDVFVLREQFEN